MLNTDYELLKFKFKLTVLFNLPKCAKLLACDIYTTPWRVRCRLHASKTVLQLGETVKKEKQRLLSIKNTITETFSDDVECYQY